MTSVHFDASRGNPGVEPSGRQPRAISFGRIGLYGFVAISVLFFVFPLYVIVVTSLKPFEETLTGSMMSLPHRWTLDAWHEAWSHSCSGVVCDGLQPGFFNSIRILIPGVAASLAVGALTGFALSFWRVPGAKWLFTGLVLGAFIPYQVFIYPMVRIGAKMGLTDSLLGITLAHVSFQMPVITLIFRNYFVGLPIEIFKAARVDGAGFLRIFFSIVLPMSGPIVVVAIILLSTHIWNDYLLGLTFAGRANYPMTVQLNNIVATETGTKFYNVDMAAVLMTTLVPLLIYFVSGSWFIRGVAAGAVKG